MKIGYCLTGSFCTFAKSLEALEALVRAGHTITPIMSQTAYTTDTRFGDAVDIQNRLIAITGNSIIHTIAQAEPVGPKKMFDVLAIVPCTGNTLAKLAAGITDTAVTMAAKSHLRNERPLVLAVSTNDGLGIAAQNIGRLMAWRSVYFVPFRQDDPVKKPRSLVADFAQILPAAEAALAGRQLQPMIF